MHALLAMLDTAHWIGASLVVLIALGLSAVCIRFRKGEGPYLCSDCRYNSAELCKKEARPRANSCYSWRPGAVCDKDVAKEIAKD